MEARSRFSAWAARETSPDVARAQRLPAASIPVVGTRPSEETKAGRPSETPVQGVQQVLSKFGAFSCSEVSSRKPTQPTT